jgi:hypothetical protein
VTVLARNEVLLLIRHIIEQPSDPKSTKIACWPKLNPQVVPHEQTVILRPYHRITLQSHAAAWAERKGLDRENGCLLGRAAGACARCSAGAADVEVFAADGIVISVTRESNVVQPDWKIDDGTKKAHALNVMGADGWE